MSQRETFITALDGADALCFEYGQMWRSE